MKFVFISKKRDETIKLGEKLGNCLKKGDIVTLTGDLGAGKTTLVSGIAKALKIKEEIISPTFNILKCYFKAKVPLYHIDAYRLEEHNKDIGLEEYIEGDGIAVIEWPIYIKELLSVKHLEIKIINKGDSKREITLTAPNKYYENIIRSVLK
ncbi:MAG: tRNA (adenosine(37)-N6)-threonylcarbamoyltransferase complex ATPase subunit type 1 TsaE [Bacilli bacterium]|nr:tRNA (adenosine(37)-N6)-threonylcarbamoyltransferase complex ATPase subunit type 1 TsaE [Bacilli bacterium]